MQKILLFALLTTFLARPAASFPNESDKDLPKVERLYLTGKIWGFLKYYHPLVGKGAFDWDEKLQGILNNTGDIRTEEAFSDYMSRWIYYLGPRGTCSTCQQPRGEDYFLKNFDLSWTQNSSFSDELKKALKDIERNRFQGDHHYVGKGKVGQFEPKNESLQYGLKWEDENQRLIPLFRFWNYIEYFFPYKYQTDQLWDDVLMEMIPKFLSVTSKQEFHLAMLELVVKVDDGQAGFVTTVLEEMPYYNYPAVRLELVENKAVVTEIIDKEKAAAQNLQLGDAIISVNNESVLELHNSHKKYIWGANDVAKNRTIQNTLFMNKKGPANVTVEREGNVRSQKLELYRYADLNYEKGTAPAKWRLIKDSVRYDSLVNVNSIGYVNMGLLRKSDVADMMTELDSTAAIIFDVRNSPQGTLYSIAKCLNREKKAFAKFIVPVLEYPGVFKWSEPYTCGEESADYYKGSVIILVNEKIQSHAEFTCMCLQTAPNVITVGSQTAGTDGSVSKFPLINRAYAAMTGIGVFYADGTEKQRAGIQPNIYVSPTIEGIRQGKDEVLEKAIAIAKEEIAKRLLEELAQQALTASDSSNVVAPDSLFFNPVKEDTVNIDRGNQ